MRNVPPMRPDQNVWVFVRLKEKSNARSRPAAPAMGNASEGETGIRSSSTTTIDVTATVTSAICLTSAQVTACTPPIMVYNTVGTPMTATDHESGQPKMAENTTAGAASMVLHDRPPESRNRNAARERVFASNRRSRYP